MPMWATGDCGEPPTQFRLFQELVWGMTPSFGVLSLRQVGTESSKMRV